mgnify:CR=1 FL=1
MFSFKRNPSISTIPSKTLAESPKLFLSPSLPALGMKLQPTNPKSSDRSYDKNNLSTSSSSNNSSNSVSKRHSLSHSSEKIPKPQSLILDQDPAPENPEPKSLPLSFLPKIETKLFRGVWEVYHDHWFDIQSRSLQPLFTELPSPQRTFPESPKLQKLPPILQPQPVTVCNAKLKKVPVSDKVLRMCDACNGKKRRGSHIGCAHFICRDCLQGHIKKHVGSRKIPIKCPKAGCKYHLDHQEVNKYAGNTELVRRHYELCVSTYVEKNPHQVVQCYTQGCGYVINLTKLKQKDVLDCPRCKKAYCIRCHKLAHRNPSCTDN